MALTPQQYRQIMQENMILTQKNQYLEKMNSIKIAEEEQYMHQPAVINPPHVDQAVYFLHKQQQIVQNQMQNFTRQSDKDI
jgi:hypothetical protein